MTNTGTLPAEAETDEVPKTNDTSNVALWGVFSMLSLAGARLFRKRFE